MCRSSSTNPIHFPHCVPSLSPPCTPAYLYQALSLSLSFVASLFFLLRTTTQTHGRTHIHSGRRKELGCTARSNYDVASILDTQFSPGFAAAISVPRIRGLFSAPVPEAAHCPSAGSASRDRAAVPCSAGSFQRAGTDHYSVTHTIFDPLAKKRRRRDVETDDYCYKSAHTTEDDVPHQLLLACLLLLLLRFSEFDSVCQWNAVIAVVGCHPVRNIGPMRACPSKLIDPHRSYVSHRAVWARDR